MSPRPVLLAAVLLALSGCAATSPIHTLRSSYTQRPVEALPDIPAHDVEALRAAHPRTSMSFFHHEVTTEHQFYIQQDTWDYVQDVRRQYVVLDPDDDVATTFSLRTDRRDVVEGVVLRVTPPGGAAQTYGLAQLIREDVDGGLAFKIAYPNVVAGSVVEESFRLRRSWDRSFQPPLFEDVRLQFESPVDRLVYRYIYPTTWGVDIKRTSRNARPAVEVDRNQAHPGYNILTVDRRNVPGFPDEPFSPYFREVGPYLALSVTEVLHPVRGVEPLYKAPTTWEEIAERFTQYVYTRRGGATGPVAQQARALADPAQADSVRLAAVVGWVQQNIEIADDGGGADLPGVLRTRRANDYLATALTQAMLEEVGLEARYLLVHPASNGFLDRGFVHGSQLTMPAVSVRLGAEERVVLPYVEGLPVTYLPEFLQGAEAMRLTPTGLDGFVRLPERDLAETAVAEAVDVRIDDEGTVHVVETATLRGGPAFGTRRRFRDLPPDEREAEAREFVTYSEGEITGFAYDLAGEDTPDAPLVLTLRYAIPDLVAVTPEEVLVQTAGLLSPASLSAFETRPGERRNPIRVYENQRTDKTIRIAYPEAWTLTTPLADVQDQTRFGRISGRYTLAPGLITVEQRIDLLRGQGLATDGRSLARLTGSDSRLYVPTLVFSVAR